MDAVSIRDGGSEMFGSEGTTIDAGSELVASVVHELRNPLAAVTGYIELALDEVPEAGRAYLETALRNAERLARMIDEMLLAASPASRPAGIERALVDLADVINDSIERIQPTANAKGIESRFHLPSSMPTLGDPTRLGQVVDNLLSNAVKYTPDRGRVTVAADVVDDAIRFVVSDTGIGIPGDELPNLFGDFYRASTAIEHGIPGTGLGLSITRSIVEAHDGTIAVASFPGEGTTVTVTLPVCVSESSFAMAAGR
jgi:signal transduction histidine kinase